MVKIVFGLQTRCIDYTLQLDEQASILKNTDRSDGLIKLDQIVQSSDWTIHSFQLDREDQDDAIDC